MKDKVLEAINGNIKKWKNIKRGKGADEGIDCPLCQLFFTNDCRGCPIYEQGGFPYCVATPWAKWSDHQRIYHDRMAGEGVGPLKILCSKCRSLAAEEIKFLKGVRKRYIKNKKDYEQILRLMTDTY